MLAPWVVDEMKSADLNDKRLNRRLEELLSVLGERPTASVPAACGGYADMLAAYRFFDNDKVTFERVLASHCQRTRERVAALLGAGCVVVGVVGFRYPLRKKGKRPTYRSVSDAVLSMEEENENWRLSEVDYSGEDLMAGTKRGPGFGAPMEYEPMTSDEDELMESVGDNLCAVAERVRCGAAREVKKSSSTLVEVKTRAVEASVKDRTRPGGRSQWLAFWAAAAAACFGLAMVNGPSPGVPAAIKPASGSPTFTKKIENVRVADYVVTDVPAGIRSKAIGNAEAAPWWDLLNAQIDPAQWRQIDLTAQSEGADWFKIVLLRPLSWIDETGAKDGGTIHLSLPEQGLDGPAQVFRIGPCPPLKFGNGRIVTGTTTHVRGGILNVYLDGLDQPLGVTENHPVYSIRHDDFVPAGELTVGDQLRKLDGSFAVVSRIERLIGEQRVYNLEVQGEHVYRVTADGLLVHNDCIVYQRTNPLTGNK